MHPPAFKKRNVEILMLWVLPSMAFAFGFFYWLAHHRLSYFGYLSLLPAIFSMLVVGLAAGPLGLWRWNNEIFPRIVFLHRPWVWTSYFHLVFISAGRLLFLPTNLGTLVESTLIIGFIGMLVGVAHDLFCVDAGIYQISGYRFDREKHGTILVVSRYAFYFFGFVGMAMGLAAKAGYYFLYESPSPHSWLTLGFAGGILVSLPFLAWIVSRYLKKK